MHNNSPKTSKATMSTQSANNRKEGGTTYKQHGNIPQHWDLVVLYGWDYFQGQITKYLMRWKTKHADAEKQVEDLRKAAHFLQKYIEEAEAGAEFPVANFHNVVEAALRAQATHVYPTGWRNFVFEGVYGGGGGLYTCRGCRSQVHTTEPDQSPYSVHTCGEGPTSAGYVDQ